MRKRSNLGHKLRVCGREAVRTREAGFPRDYATSKVKPRAGSPLVTCHLLHMSLYSFDRGLNRIVSCDPWRKREPPFRSKGFTEPVGFTWKRCLLVSSENIQENEAEEALSCQDSALSLATTLMPACASRWSKARLS